MQMKNAEDEGSHPTTTPDASRESRKKALRDWLVPVSVAAVLSTVLIVVTVSSVRPPEDAKPLDNTEDLGVAMLGRPAPDFEIELLSSGTFRLSKARGKIVLVNFWGTWCAPCEQEMPLLERASKEFGEELIVIGLAVNDSNDSVTKFVSRLGITFPIALDNGRIAGHYLVTGFPTSILVDKDGKVASRVSRAFPDYKSLKEEIEQALEEKEESTSDFRR